MIKPLLSSIFTVLLIISILLMITGVIPFVIPFIKYVIESSVEWGFHEWCFKLGLVGALISALVIGNLNWTKGER